MSALSWVLQMYLAGAWTDIQTDALAAAPITCDYGIDGNNPNERVASTGTLAFALDNSVANSAGVLGRYSPLNTSRRTGYDFNVKVRWRLTDGTNTRYKFLGRLSDALPSLDEDQYVSCKAVDWMDEAATIDLPDLAAQINKRHDEIVQSILSAMDADDQPAASVLEVGRDTFPIALDGGLTGQRPKIREVLIDLCKSEYGAAYVKGDATQGGTFMLENRAHRAANPTVYLTLTASDFQLGGLVVPGSRDDIYSSVQVFLRPSRIDTAATTVLFSLQTAQTIVEPAETNDTIFGPYRDPSNNDQIGGTATVAPVATTDYTMNAAADGSSTDLTANFTVTASATGIGVRFTITNNGTTPGYITRLQLRGKGIYRYDAMVEVAVAGAYGTRPFPYDMPVQSNLNVANDVATYLSQLLQNPLAWVRSVRFLATENATLLAQAILREPGDRFALQEDESGIDNEFTINKVRLEATEDGHLWCTWFPEPASLQRFWLWGVAGVSEWGDTTYYAF